MLKFVLFCLLATVLFTIWSAEFYAKLNPSLCREYAAAKASLKANLKALGMGLVAVIAILLEIALLIFTLGTSHILAGKYIRPFNRRLHARFKLLVREARLLDPSDPL